MADFIAVIRRAVDGLNDNTPEVRARVYAKARSAVQRQLENMKPQPPEEMLRRQMEKLDSAIEDVEAEYSEALPPAVEPEPEAPLSAEPEEDIAAISHDEADERPHVETGPAVEPEPEAYGDEPAGPEEPSNSWNGEEHGAEAPAIEDEEESVPTAPEEMISDDAGAGYLPADDGFEPVYHDGQIEPRDDEVSSQDETAYDGSVDADNMTGPETAHAEWPVEIDEEPAEWVEPEEPVVPEVEEPHVRMPKADFDESKALAEFGDLLENTNGGQQGARKEAPTSDFSWDAPFDDLPETPKPVAFQEALEAKQSAIKSEGVADNADAAKGRKDRKAKRAEATKDPLADLDELIGYSRKKGAATETDSAAAEELPDDINRVVSKLEGRSFKTQPRQSNRKMVIIALAAVVLLTLAGGGFALWYYRTDGALLATGADTPDVAAAGDNTETAQTTDPVVPDAGADETGTPEVTAQSQADTGNNDAAVAADPDPAAANTEVAALETPAAGPQKFTQRLLTDGTETAGEGDPVSVDAALPEGTSVAGQTVASAAGDEQPTGTATEAASGAADGKNPVDTAVAGLAVTQKMFLYEERLGQGTPTASTGTVSWNLKNEAADNGKAEPVVEGHIDVADRDFKALVTIKRNTDKSLPASHIIEIVFQLPKDFEGGNIESVERIALKQNEQDRGNALIAVPAKITDDFHMIALNDDKDAIANNIELLKSRSWIDIPIKYRNGRRALITLEKGASGTAVFEKAMTEWAALGKTAEN